MSEQTDKLNTLFIVNPHAAGGKAYDEWQRIEPTVREILPRYRMMLTQTIDDVEECLHQARQANMPQVISVGGDGTNNAIVNAIMRHNDIYPEHQFIFGSIPAGTGRDWARGIGLPLDTRSAVVALLESEPQPVDIGQVNFDGKTHYFLNTSSAGVSNDVAQRVENTRKRRAWTFLCAIVTSLATYQPEAMRIELDGEPWYEGEIYIATVANGRSFGQGLLIAPDAQIDDGLLDVVIIEKMHILRLIQAFPSVYSGGHVRHPKVKSERATHIRIVSQTQAPIAIELDGEPASGNRVIEYRVRSAVLKMLLGHR